MQNPLRFFFTELIPNVRLADVLDVLLVAAFIYAFITWLRESTSRSASRRTLIAVTAFALIYALALLLELYLVKTLIKLLLAVLLLGAVVVFQADIRRMVDRLGTWGPFRRLPQKTAPSAAAVNLLAEAAARMAESRTGALIALRGREPWDRYIEGGIRLEGKVSLPLLYSIFSPDSPGHDGVVLIEGDEVKMFGAHLPLASNLPEPSQFGGTRHAAALGLAEVSDALVIVVSEERGTISIAERGQLEEMPTVGDLKARLTQFWEKHYSAQPPAHVQWWYRRSWQHGLASLAMATLLWVIFAYRPETVYRTFIVPVELRNLESEWRLDDSVPTEARVTLIGSEQAYRGLDPSSLIISLNLSEIEEGTNEFIITEENLQQLPSNIRLYNVSPRAVAIEAQPQRVVTVPVEVPTVGTLPDSLELVSIRPDPRSAALAVPESTGRAPEQVLTEPVDLGKITGSTRLRRKLAPGIDVRLGSQQSQEVTVDVEVRLRPPDSR